MNQFKKAFQDISSKVPKGMPQGGGGMLGGLAKGAGVLLGLGLTGYGAYESVVTGIVIFSLYFYSYSYPLFICHSYPNQHLSSHSEVKPGHLGIIYNRFPIGSKQGIQDVGVCREGLNFVVPWFQRAIIYDIRTRPKLVNSTSGSKGEKQ